MLINADRDDLLASLGRVVGVVERRQTLPILAYLKVKAEGERIEIMGTDLEVGITVSGRAEVKEGGEGMVPARKLFDICRSIPAGAKVELRQDGGKTTVKSGRSRFTLVSLPVADFPGMEIPAWETDIQIKQGELRELLDNTHFCMAQQDVRYYLNGILLDVDGKHLNVVATDGHRLAISTHEMKYPADRPRQAIVPRKGVQELLRILDTPEEEITLKIGTNHVCVAMTSGIVVSKLIDSRYPDYNKVIPKNLSKKLSLDREPFQESLGRVSILSNDKYRGVRIGLKSGTMSISANNPEQEEAVEELAVNYKEDPLEVGFNVSYLLDAVRALHSTEIVLGLNDANSGCTIMAAGKNYPLYVIMPMRM